MNRNLFKKTAALFFFAVAMAFLESTVVVYLRELYYPEGFHFPLKEIPAATLIVELLREAATIIMLAAMGYLAGRKNWQRFGAFVFIFGVWDIMYYVFLKIVLDWPASFGEFDILFLIPLPWIAPIIAPILISLLMIGVGLVIMRIYDSGGSFFATRFSWVAAILATGLILYSFIRDSQAGFRQSGPEPYPYWILALGLGLYIAGFIQTLRFSHKSG